VLGRIPQHPGRYRRERLIVCVSDRGRFSWCGDSSVEVDRECLQGNRAHGEPLGRAPEVQQLFGDRD
jgi:hypothetical protein